MPERFPYSWAPGAKAMLSPH